MEDVPTRKLHGSSHLIKSTHSFPCGVTYLCNNILVVNTWCSGAGLSLKAMRASYFQRNKMKTEPKEFPSSCSIPYLQTPQLEIIGSLSSDVFERRTSTGSEPFSLFMSLDATVFVLLSVTHVNRK